METASEHTGDFCLFKKINILPGLYFWGLKVIFKIFLHKFRETALPTRTYGVRYLYFRF